MTPDQETIIDLRNRVRLLEDERAIARLIASYGPAVDCANANGAASLWAEDGSYDVEGWRMTSSSDIRAMVSSASHGELVAAGCCHFLGPAVVTVSGDNAVALCAAANHFELQRREEGWRITKRTSRMLDGIPAGHRLLIAGATGAPLGAEADERGA
ncbi:MULTISPECIES: nuclear transport factor 2 family protein [unclassified Mycolicibacterium]|uniref:nuclear transport factor 2 family protein n=1 Tax=unclassified Mycolicibacterium TaxID=2636767 RepID=UPI002ED9192A